jgi:hypothetical protein
VWWALIGYQSGFLQVRGLGEAATMFRAFAHCALSKLEAVFALAIGALGADITARISKATGVLWRDN